MGPNVLWGIVAGFLLGVFARSFIVFGWSAVGYIALLALATLLLTFFDSAKRSAGILCAIALFSCAIGIMRMEWATLPVDATFAAHVGEKVVIEGVVRDEPDVRESNERLSLRAEALVVGTTTIPVRAGVLIIAPLHSGVVYGDRIRAEGTLRLPEAFETGTGREFNYPAFLAKDGIQYELAFAREIEVIGRGRTNPVKTGAIWIKQTFLEGLGRALPEPQAGLAGGITVGDKRGLGSELSDVFRIVGLVHIVVLSGYNIMIVMYGLSRFLEWLHASRFLRFGSSIAIAILFALMTGLAAASVRAAAMATIAVVGQATGRMYLAARALALVGTGMVVWNPYILAHDPGFQLSVLATAGLIAFTPKMVTRLRYIPAKFGLREIAATTLATQFAVLPLLLYQSGQVPVYSFFANILALVAVPYAMLFSAIAALAGLVLGPLATIVGFPAYVLLAYIIGIADLLASLPFSSLAIPAFSAWWLFVIYTTMLLFTAYGKTRTDRPEKD